MEGDQLVKNAEKIEEFRSVYTDMRNKWQKDAVARDAVVNVPEETKQEDNEAPDAEKFRNILEGREDLTDDNMQEMMGKWMEEAGQMEEMNKMMEAWGNTWQEDSENQMQRNPNVIQFQ